MTDSLMTTTYFVTLACVILFIYTGILLCKKGIESKKYNLIYLSISYFMLNLMYIFIVLSTNWTLFHIANIMGFLFLIIFINKTYYQNMRSPYRKILVFFIINWVFQFILSIGIHDLGVIEMTVLTRAIDHILDVSASVVLFFWYGIATFNSLQLLVDKEIEPWIKARLRYVAYSSFVMMFVEVPDVLRIDPSVGYADMSNPISVFVFFSQLAIIVFFVISQSLAWIMPNRFKEYLNNKHEFGFSEDNEELTEELVLKRLQDDIF